MKQTMLIPAAMLAFCKAATPDPLPPPGVVSESITVTSNTFPSGGAIPVDASCDGSERSPELVLSAPPEGARSLAVIVEDPDAPSGAFTHWIAFNLPPDTRVIPEGFEPASVQAKTGLNDFKSVRYGGPCPPRHEMHRYVFRVFALDSPVPAPEGADRNAVASAMNGHVLAHGALTGTFAR